MSSPLPQHVERINPDTDGTTPITTRSQFARSLSNALERVVTGQSHALESVRRKLTADPTFSDRPVDELPPTPTNCLPVLDPSCEEELDSIGAVKDLEQATGSVVRRSFIPPSNRWKAYLMQEVAHNTYLEAQLIFLTFTTGILDAMTFTTYRVFVTKQTGNTIFLALYALGHPSVEGIEKNVGMSISMFLLGAAFFGHTGHLVNQRRRSWLLTSNFIQACLVITSSIIEYTINHNSTGAAALVTVALLSFASGGQIALALCVKLPELNTTMITGCLIQLSTDRNVLALKNVARDRRLCFYGALVAGAFVGAAASKTVGPQLALLLAAICKVLVFVSFLFNHGMVVAREVVVPGEKEKEKVERPAEGYATPLTKVLWGD